MRSARLQPLSGHCQQGSFRWSAGPGALRLEIDAETEPGVYVAAVEAFGELLCGQAAARGNATTRHLEVDASSRPRLLVEVLAELALLAETDAFIPTGVELLIEAERRLEAIVRGRIGERPRPVGAVTYRDLRFEPDGSCWRACV